MMRNTTIPRLFWCFLALVGLAAFAHVPSPVHAQGFSPAEAGGRMSVADGLEVRLVAAEPLIRQPVAIEFDDRGRLWVIQYMQYPNPAELKRVAVDRYSRTVYDRFPDPPPRGPKGADRITILEDSDGDGQAEHSRDFVTGLNLASGLAFGYGGVFVIQVPYLLFYPDRDRDDRPDGDPEVLLSGFGMHDAHSVANSLTWGPDGWLYGLQGSTVTAKVRGIEFQQGVWRYHPTSKRFELFCEGGGNMWGLDFDREGQLFASTNVGGFVMLHGVQGGYYWKSFGKHGPLHNPYAFGYFDHVRHTGVDGGHVSVGGLFYDADALPQVWRGRYIAADLLGHAIRGHEVTRLGSTFQARQVDDLLRANDTWFAPSDQTLGPDGALYVTDWHDRRTAHPDPDADWDRSNGRIFAVTAHGAKVELARDRDLTTKTNDALVALLNHPNVWYRRKARRLLTERRAVDVAAGLRETVAASRGVTALEALWALHGCVGLDEATAEMAIEHPDADVRAWCVRLVGDEPSITSRLATQLAEMAAREPDVSQLDEPSIASPLLAAYPRKDQAWRSQARELLLSRVSWARAYLAAVDRGEIAVNEVTLDQLGRFTTLRDPQLATLVRKHWGVTRGSTREEKLAEVRRLNNDLRAATGDTARGRQLFRERCATCHRLEGEGETIGPDLTYANRRDRDFLLVSLVDPAGVVRKEYQAYHLATKDGRVLSGLIVEQSPDVITLRGAKGERTRVARSEIDELKEIETSLMPESLYKEFSSEQLRDLFSFLQTEHPEGRKGQP